ncbi:transcriptional repressor [bacterium]|nr:MAG: transcriptional repressor [bacterium]
MMEIINKFKGKGFKLTPQRLSILKFLDGNTSHPTAEDIFKALKKTHPTVSFATVYNTVQALRDRGELQEITIDPEKKHFDPNTAPHHHIMCTACKRVEDVFADYSSALQLPENVSKNFAVSGNHVDFYGICKKCRS